MKTPREIILERHRSAESKLREIHPEELAALVRESAGKNDEGANLSASLRSLFGGFWQESVWPWRRSWAGLAAIWTIILALHLGVNASSSRAGGNEVVATNNAQVQTALREQKQMLAQLLEQPALPSAAQPVKTSGPRSDIRRELFIA